MAEVTNAQIASIPGWFGRVDVAAFRVLLRATGELMEVGDLAELGAFQGRSAVLIGAHRRPGEQFTVIDLWGADADDAANARENDEQYASLSRGQFESHYRAVHGDLPTVVQGPSHRIVEHAAAGRHRFVHIDASHLYEHVVVDLRNAQALCQKDAVVVLDDISHSHTPGVAAAAWQAVADGLHPFLLTTAKMYATWGDPAPYVAAVEAWLAGSPDEEHERQSIAGNDVVRVWTRSPAVTRFVPPVLVPALQRVRAHWKH